ncbi:uncharacterized protein LOC141621748 [Silene latifolia]|uniref:uncharacterized protein LOC141621748 n=1 Tax=Silene latifolia TaxID=37657 RepID=UPI003D76FE2B
MSWGGGESSGPGVKLDREPNLDQARDPSYKKNAATHFMSNEQIKAAGVEGSKRPPGHNPGEVLHQRSRLPFKVPTMAIAGFAIVGLIGYGVLYSKKKREADAIDVARVATNTATPQNTDFRPKK